MSVDSCPFLLRVRAPRRSAASRRDEVDLDDRAVEHDAGGRNDGHDWWLRHHPTIDAFEAAIVLGVEQIDVSVDDVLERRPLEMLYPDGTGLLLPQGAPMGAFVRGVWRARGWTLRERLALLRSAATWAARRFRCEPRLNQA